jgi:DNA processing protein
LIRENTAKLVATPEQLCQELNLIATGIPATIAAQPEAQKALFEKRPAPVTAMSATAKPDDHPLLKWLANGPLHIDEIARNAGLPIAQVSGSLQILELEGRVRSAGAMTYSIA